MMEVIGIAWAFLKKAWPFLVGAAIVIGALFWYNHQITLAEKRGAAAVQVQWDADKARRIKLTTDVTMLWAAGLEKTEIAVRAKQKEIDDEHAKMDARIKVLSQDHTIFLYPDTVSVLNDITAPISTDPGPAPKSAEGTPAVPAVPQGVWISQADLAAFTNDAKAAYDSSVAMFHECRQRYDDVRAPTLTKEASP